MKATLTLVIDDKEVNEAVTDLITTAGTTELPIWAFIEMYQDAVGRWKPKASAKKTTVKKSGKKK